MQRLNLVDNMQLGKRLIQQIRRIIHQHVDEHNELVRVAASRSEM
jgi:hypothetical protein